LLRENQAYKQEIPQLNFLTENMDEHAKNIETLQGKVVRLQAERQNLSFWDGKRKKELGTEIEQTLGNIRVTQHHFKKKFGIDPDQAPDAIERTQAKIRAKEDALSRKIARISTIREHQAAIELKYQTQKLLAEIHPNRQQIEKTLEKLTTPPRIHPRPPATRTSHSPPQYHLQRNFPKNHRKSAHTSSTNTNRTTQTRPRKRIKGTRKGTRAD